MTPTEYRRMTAKDLLGRRVVTVKRLQNGYGIVPEGAMATIEEKFNGLGLVFDPCDHCGFKPRVSRVPSSYIDLLEPRWPPVK